MAAFIVFCLLFLTFQIKPSESYRSEYYPRDAIVLTKSLNGSQDVYTSGWLKRNATLNAVAISTNRRLEINTVDIKFKSGKIVEAFNWNSTDLHNDQYYRIPFKVQLGEQVQIVIKTAQFNESQPFKVEIERINEERGCPIKECYFDYRPGPGGYRREEVCNTAPTFYCDGLNNQCIEADKVCDGGHDCHHGIDESNCNNIRCDFNNGTCDWKNYVPDLGKACLYHICPKILPFNYTKPTDKISDGPIFDDLSQQGKSGYMLLKVIGEKPNGNFSTQQVFGAIIKETPVKGKCKVNAKFMTDFELQVIVKGEDTKTGEIIDISQGSVYSDGLFHSPNGREWQVEKQLNNPTKIIINVVAENVGVNTKRFVAIDNISFSSKCVEVKK